MLPKQYRLPLRTELKRIQKEGTLIQGRLFSLLVAKQSQTAQFGIRNSRFGFIISSKIHKKAVKRNRAKRLLGETVLSLSPKIKPGFDVVFLAKKGIIGVELKEVQAEVKNLFVKAGMVK